MEFGRGFECRRHFFNGTDLETGESRAFFIDFYFCNRSIGSEKPVMGQRRPNPAPSYMMVNAGSWGRDGAQLHKFYGWKRIDLKDENSFEVSAGECFLSDDATRGSVRITPDDASGCREAMTQAGTMSWSLVFEKRSSFRVLLRHPSLLWNASGLRTTFKGDVVWNGRRYTVKPSSSFGFVDSWSGPGFAAPWMFLTSSRLKNRKNGRAMKRSAVASGICLGRGGKPLPVSVVDDGNRKYRFSAAFPFCRSTWSVEETKHMAVWHLRQKTLLRSLEVELVCRRSDMVTLRYEKPCGGAPACIVSGGNGSGRVVLRRAGRTVLDAGMENVRCEYVKTL